MRHLIDAKDVVLVVGSGVSVSATGGAPATRCVRTGAWTNWGEDMA